MRLKKQEFSDISKVWKTKNMGEKKQEKIMQLMQELQELCCESGIVVEYKFAKQGEQLISDKVNEMKDKLMGRLKRNQDTYRENKENGMKDKLMGRFKRYQDTYRENKERKEEVLREYEESLREIQEIYQESVEKIERNRRTCHNQELSCILAYVRMKQEKSFQDIGESPQDIGDVMQIKQNFQNPKNKKKYLRELEHYYDEQLINCEIERMNAIDDAIEKKDKELRAMKKQNIFQKIAGALINQRDDTKVFQEKVSYLKEEKVPEVRQRTESQTEDFCERMNKKIEKIVGRNQNVTANLMGKMQARVTGNIDTVKDMKTKGTEEQPAFMEI